MKKKDYSLKRIIKERPMLSGFIGFFILSMMPFHVWVLAFHILMVCLLVWAVEKVFKSPPKEELCPCPCGPVEVEVEELSESFLLKQSILVTLTDVRVYTRELATWNKDAADVLTGLSESLIRLYSFLEANPDRYIETYDVYKDVQIVINNLKPVVATYNDVPGYISKEGLEQIVEKLKAIVGSKVDLIGRRIDVLFGLEADAVVKAIDEMGKALDELGTGTDSKVRN